MIRNYCFIVLANNVLGECFDISFGCDGNRRGKETLPSGCVVSKYR